MSMKTLRKAVKKSQESRDDFEVGTVIRWVSADTYIYAALKTSVGWFTTARDFNNYVAQTLEWKDLLEVLSRAETSDVAVSTEWVDVVESLGDNA